jgi:hypothetical protein
MEVVAEHSAPSAEQVSPVQQSWLAPPQAVQLPLEQTTSAAVQVLPVQQGWPAWPQETEHRWPLPQDSPAMQAPHSMMVPEQGSVTFPQRLPESWPHTIVAGVHAASASAPESPTSFPPSSVCGRLLLP